MHTPQISDGSPIKSLLRLIVRGILTALALRKTVCSLRNAFYSYFLENLKVLNSESVTYLRVSYDLKGALFSP